MVKVKLSVQLYSVPEKFINYACKRRRNQFTAKQGPVWKKKCLPIYNRKTGPYGGEEDSLRLKKDPYGGEENIHGKKASSRQKKVTEKSTKASWGCAGSFERVTRLTIFSWASEEGDG